MVPSEEFKYYQQVIINKKLSMALKNVIIMCKSKISDRVKLIKESHELHLKTLMSRELQGLDDAFKEFYNLIPLLSSIKNDYIANQSLFESLHNRLESIDKSIICRFEDWKECEKSIDLCIATLNEKNINRILDASTIHTSISDSVNELERIVSECQRMSDSIHNRRLLVNKRPC